MAVIQVVHCPNCGAPAEIRNPAIVQVTCAYCRTIFLWDWSSARDTGKRARRMPAISGLAIGTRGRLRDHAFTVIGRVRYAFGEGVWDEWFLERDDGSFLWLSEDMGRLILEKPVDLSVTYRPEEVRPGLRLRVGDRTFTVREVGRAHCIGAEGQLPFVVEPDETYPYANAVDETGRAFLSLEFDQRRGASAFLGVYLREEEITYERHTVVKRSRDIHELSCPQCGSPLELRGHVSDIVTIVCAACGANIHLSEDVARVVGLVQSKWTRYLTIPLGATGRLRGTPYTVVGRMLYEWEEDGVRGYNAEYLLYHPEKGYMWLAEADGHYALGRPIDTVPRPDPFQISRPKRRFTVRERSFQFFESGTLTVVYVDGALPWEARVGDRIRYAEGVAPPWLFTAEQVIVLRDDGTRVVREVEYFLSRYIPHEEVAAAFQVTLPRPRGVAPAQPYRPIPGHRWFTWIGLLATLLTMAACFRAATSGKTVLTQQFTLQDLMGREQMTPPFRVDRPEETLRVTVAAPMTNRYIDLSVAVIRDDTDTPTAVALQSDTVEYYEGYEDGEKWTEGSRSKGWMWRLPEPGRYRVLLTVHATDAAPSQSLTVRVQTGVHNLCCMPPLVLGWLLLPVTVWAHRRFFESRRWQPVLEDEDEDE